MVLCEKLYLSESRSLRAKRRAVDRSHEAAIAYLALCVAHRDQCELVHLGGIPPDYLPWRFPSIKGSNAIE